MKKGLNPGILILIIVLFAIQCTIIFSMIYRLYQPGGASSYSDLVSDYQTAINNSDEDLYLSLIPRSERNGLEREAVQLKLREHSDDSYTMSVDSYDYIDTDVTGETMGELFSLDPMGSPFISNSISLSVLVTDADNNSYIITLDVLEINGRYFIHDVKL